MIDLIQTYKDLHQIPEPSFEEFQTQKYLLNKLKKLNCDIHTLEPTGIIAFFDFNQKKTIAFRAEMDGLPIIEKTGLAYASTNNFMHACAHDAHMSILLSFCYYINQIKANTNIVAIFQPSEESYGGAIKVINDEYFKELNVSEIYGLHFFPKLPFKKIYTKEKLMASAMEIDYIIKGKNAHLLRGGIDAIKVGREILEAIKIRKNEVFNCGVFQASGKRNIICDNASLECTYRTYNDPNCFIKKNQQLIKKIEKCSSAKIDCFYRVIPVLKNDLNLIRNLKIELLKDTLFQAEDFAFYTQKIPALFVLIGCGDTSSLHTDNFVLNLELLEVGLEVFKQIKNCIV